MGGGYFGVGACQGDCQSFQELLCMVDRNRIIEEANREVMETAHNSEKNTFPHERKTFGSASSFQCPSGHRQASVLRELKLHEFSNL